VKGFRQFLMRGNLIELAVAVVIGTAFTAIVTAIVKDLITPLIAAIVGKPDFSNMMFRIRGTPILVGDLLTALTNFLVVAAVLFMLVKAISSAMVKPQAVEERKSKDCPYCLTPIPLAATRCPACTSTLEPVAAG